jgi:hypothetical protein
MVFGPPNWSSDISQKLGASGPGAFGEYAFWKMTPKQKELKFSKVHHIASQNTPQVKQTDDTDPKTEHGKIR